MTSKKNLKIDELSKEINSRFGWEIQQRERDSEKNQTNLGNNKLNKLNLKLNGNHQ
jgi:hypothetical protein